MSTIVLFHSALGLRPAVHRFAETLRAAGHEVHTPDLFDGEVFDDLEAGVAKRDALGIPTLSARAAESVADLPNELVYAGFSMGAASAQWLAATRPGAVAAILLHAVLPPAALGVEAWPNVPVQVHTADADPWVDATVLDAVAATGFDVHRYPGDGHLFTDEDASEFDAESAAKVKERVLAFLSGL